MRQPTLVRTAFRRISRKQATPRTPGPYDTITRLPSVEARAKDAEDIDPRPVWCPPRLTRPEPPSWSLPDEAEIKLRVELLLRCGEYGGAA